MTKTNCSTCLNTHTAICSECSRTEYRGKPGKPSHWCGQENVLTDRLSIDDIAVIIAARVAAKAPIPIHLVTKYNEIITEVRDGNKE